MGFLDFLKNDKGPSHYTTSMSTVVSLVQKCQKVEHTGNLQAIQDALFELYSCFNKPGGGRLIIDYPNKADLGLCFAFLLKYDWEHNPSLREVWAEDGFYCFMEHLDHQGNGRQGQAEAFLLFFALLCAGRDSLKPKFQDILDKAATVGNPVFHADDYRIGAQNIIDQLALLCTSGIRDMGPSAASITGAVLMKFNGAKFFEQTIHRTDLMKYDPMDVINKLRFIARVIGSILEDV